MEAFNPISELRKPEGEIEEGKVLRRRRRRGGQHFCLLLLSFFFFFFPRRPFKGPKKLFFAIPPHLHFPLSILHSRESSRLPLLFHLSLLPPPKSKIHNLPPFHRPPTICPDFRLKLFLPSSLLSWFLAEGGKWMDEKKASPGGKKTTQIRKKAFYLLKKVGPLRFTQFCYHSRLLFGTRKVFFPSLGKGENSHYFLRVDFGKKVCLF